MNNIKSLFTVFVLLVFLATHTSIAYASVPSVIDTVAVEDDNEDGDYTVIKEGEAAPYDGFLFDSDGLIKIMANKSFQIEKLRIEKDSEIKKLNIELDILKQQHKLELNLNKELFNNVILIKDRRIEQLEDSKKFEDIKLFGSMLLGMALSVTIFYAAVKITNVNQ
jgi:hypothetical protein